MSRVHTFGLTGIAAAVLASAAFYAGRHTQPSESLAMAAVAPASVAASAADRKPLYWHDPMVPGTRFDKPGKSPFMDMQLVPVYADGAGDAGVKVDPTIQQNLGMRTALVKRSEVSSDVAAVGTVQFDERLSVSVQTRVNGYVERLLVRAPMEQVRKGQALVTVFAPEWLGPQNEWLALKRAGVAQELVDAARDRLRALSIPDALVRQSEEAGTAQARFTLTAPISGVVAELGVREGVAVSAGMTLFRIAGLEKVWAVADVPEAQAMGLVRGRKVKAQLQADESRSFEGVLQEVLPQVNASTRTLQARFGLDNRTGQLTPGMLLKLQLAGPAAMRLMVPAEAVIRTGKRAVVFVAGEGGRFAAREIALGQEAGEFIEVTRGLDEGERVVVSGQFLVDSEARLKSVDGLGGGK